MRWQLIPTEEKFFADFAMLAGQLVRGSKMLDEMLSVDPPKVEMAQAINSVEHACDVVTHDIIQRLHRTFITPFDREDIHQLARSLDDVMDAIDAAAIVLRIYKINQVRFGGRELTQIIMASAEEVSQAVAALEHRKGVLERAMRVNRLEHEADLVHQEALTRLFAEERDPVEIMKCKEILDFLEQATDRCEDVANVLESVVVKHA